MTTTVTELLQGVSGNPGPVMEQLLPLIYQDLRGMARRQLAKERASHTLCTTALVHEVYLKLVDDKRASSKGRAYFFAAAARAMRQILVDHARRKRRIKRGGGLSLTEFKDNEVSTDDFLGQIVDLEVALTQLESLSSRQVAVVECRVFAGLDVNQTAQALDTSPRTVKREWAIARAWLYRALKKEDDA